MLWCAVAPKGRSKIPVNWNSELFFSPKTLGVKRSCTSNVFPNV